MFWYKRNIFRENNIPIVESNCVWKTVMYSSLVCSLINVNNEAATDRRILKIIIAQRQLVLKTVILYHLYRNMSNVLLQYCIV
jgi:hypothetical protein